MKLPGAIRTCQGQVTQDTVTQASMRVRAESGSFTGQASTKKAGLRHCMNCMRAGGYSGKAIRCVL